MYFSQTVYTVYNWVWASGAKTPEAGEFSRIFVLKVTRQSVRLLFTKLHQKWGAGCITCSPNNFWGELLPLPSDSRAYHDTNIWCFFGNVCQTLWGGAKDTFATVFYCPSSRICSGLQ